MDDLISRSALLVDIGESVVFSGRSGETSAEMRGAHKIADRIKAAPAVDAVEVVRCGKCVNFRRHTKINTEFGACSIGNVTKHESGYCDSGERS